MMRKILIIFFWNVLILNFSQAGTLIYSTLLGGSGNDYSSAIAVDVAGNVYITGQTGSSDFPTTFGVYDTTFNGGSYDAFVAKLSPDLSSLIYSTLIGGNAADGSEGLAVDSQGNVYLTGYTFSTTFPTTSGAYNVTNSGGSDVFVCKLSPSGNSLVYSTLLGGNGSDYGYGIALDSSGDAYITGYAGSFNFPVTPNAYETTNTSAESAFVTELDSTGATLIYSTFIGGNNLCQGNGIVVDSAGNAYITGQTYATNFPTTHGAFDTTFNGNEEAFVLKLNPSGSSLIYSTLLGGSGNDIGAAITIDTTGNTYVTGNTTSPNFPTVRGSFDTSNRGGRDIFVTKLNSTGTTLVFSTLIGGSGDDYGNAIALDSLQNVYITGITQSPNFPLTSGTNDTSFHGGVNDAYVCELSSSGTSLLYSTYLGGEDDDEGYGIALDSAGKIYLTGITSSPDFPVTFGTYNTSSHGGYDLFVCKYDFNIPTPILSSVPSLKLFIGQGLNDAFNLENFNNGGSGTDYSMPVNFLALSTLTESTTYQSSYSSATSGSNVFKIINALGASTATNKVKYSTYKIDKLPKIGLTAGSSWDITMTNYISNSLGPIIPPSFGNPSSLTMSEPSMVTAFWVGNTVVRVQSLQPFSGPVYVDVIASPVSAPPYGTDIDKEQIAVYSNLLAQSTFSTANDTTAYGLEIPPGRTILATSSWLSTYTDSGGTQANGVWQFTFANSSAGVKATPQLLNWIPMTTNQWYIMRMRVVATGSNNTHQSFLYGFNNLIGQSVQTDISANVWFGIPTVWTWQETPLLVHGNSATGYLQFLFKASTIGNIYIDELQIINSPPTLVDANRNNTRLYYPYGNFNISSDTEGWGEEIYSGAGSSPTISVSNNALHLNFAEAGSGSNQKGIKWTANNGGVGAATFSVTPGREVGVRATFTIESGVFNSSGIMLLSAYGVQTDGQQNIGVPASNLIASAGVGVLVSGIYRTVAKAVNPYYQFQFGIRSDQPGLLAVSTVDFDRDEDDPDYGDPTLFP